MTNKPLLSFKLTSANCVKYYLRDAALCCPLLAQSTSLAAAHMSTFREKADMPIAPRNFRCGQGATSGERSFCHPCFAARLGGVSGGKETHWWRDSSHTAMVGAGKFGSAKLPMATATYPGKPSPCQKTVEPHVGQKRKDIALPLADVPLTAHTH